jgi:hypothetical protein
MHQFCYLEVAELALRRPAAQNKLWTMGDEAVLPHGVCSRTPLNLKKERHNSIAKVM